MNVDTRVELAGIPLRNPVLTASGTFGYGTEFAPFMDLREIGGFVAKSLTLEPRVGNPPPRIAEAASGMLNSISLENVGVRAFIEEKLPAIPDGVVVIASAFETEIDRYAEVCKRLTGVPRVAGIEVGHFTETRRPTGCTVIITREGAVAGVDVRGAAPGTRETDLLHPSNLVDKVHAIMLAYRPEIVRAGKLAKALRGLLIGHPWALRNLHVDSP